jgi:hypothetical protein
MADYYTHAIIDAMKKCGWELSMDRCGVGRHARFEIGTWPYPGSKRGVGIGRNQDEAIKNAALDALLGLDAVMPPEIVEAGRKVKLKEAADETRG